MVVRIRGDCIAWKGVWGNPPAKLSGMPGLGGGLGENPPGFGSTVQGLLREGVWGCPPAKIY